MQQRLRLLFFADTMRTQSPRSVLALALLLLALLHPFVHRETPLTSGATASAQNDCSCAHRAEPQVPESHAAGLILSEDEPAYCDVVLSNPEPGHSIRDRAPPSAVVPIRLTV